MDIEESFRRRELKKIPPNKKKSEASKKIAESMLEKSKKLYDANFFDQTLITCYTSIFHTARSLLYKIGIQEKGHFATYNYISEKYSQIIPKSLLNQYEYLLKKRHELLYGLNQSEINKDTAQEAIINAEGFLNKIKEITPD